MTPLQLSKESSVGDITKVLLCWFMKRGHLSLHEVARLAGNAATIVLVVDGHLA